MLLISCPFCGPRAQIEFVFGGQSGIVRPQPPQAVSDQEWAEYLFYRENPKGEHYERWGHWHGCGLWFSVLRNTVTHRIAKAVPIDEPREVPA